MILLDPFFQVALLVVLSSFFFSVGWYWGELAFSFSILNESFFFQPDQPLSAPNATYSKAVQVLSFLVFS